MMRFRKWVATLLATCACGIGTAQAQQGPATLAPTAIVAKSISCGGSVGTTGTVLIGGTPCAWTANPAVTTVTANQPNIIAVSTDGFIAANATAATAGVPVQQSPRIRLRSNVWNTTAVAANNTNDWWIESVPVSGTTPSGLLKFGSSLNGGAATFPATLSSAGIWNSGPGSAPAPTYGFSGVSNGNGLYSAASNTVDISVGGAQQYRFVNGGQFFIQNNTAGTGLYMGNSQDANISRAAAGQFSVMNASVGFGIDANTDAVAKFRTRAQTGYATVDALAYNLAGAPAVVSTAPTVTSGFGSGTAGTLVTGSTAFAFRVTVGTNAGGTTGVIGLPTATNFWNCFMSDQTTPLDITRQTSSTASSATFTTTVAWTTGDILIATCHGS